MSDRWSASPGAKKCASAGGSHNLTDLEIQTDCYPKAILVDIGSIYQAF